MTDYKLLAIRYLKQNKSRSIITIIGATITVTLLYALLNTGYGYLLWHRQELRETKNYELVMLTETQEQIEAILADSKVKDAYIGTYYYHSIDGNTYYDNALYLNTTNPYKLDTIAEQLSNTYGTIVVTNNELAWTYLQGSEGSLIEVLIYFSALVAYIFAIIGVGIIRNSIQLNMFENIRDYGNLRCIGSSKNQLKAVIFLQGIILELIGIVLGSILGTITTMIISFILSVREAWNIQGGFHWIPMLLILVAFVIDMYFAMDENAKLVTKMTPVSAIRGEYRIKKERIKLREKNPIRILMSKIFGVDGDYAFKSLMRSPGRFFRTVGALVFGIAGFMAISGLYSTVVTPLLSQMNENGYYQFWVENELSIEETINQVEAAFPAEEGLQRIANSREMTESKLSYTVSGLTYDTNEWFNHYTDEYLEYNDWLYEWREDFNEYMNAEGKEDRYFDIMTQCGLNCYGYNQEDLDRCKANLQVGTTDLSKNGIILVNSQTFEEFDENDWIVQYKEFDLQLFDYDIGDEIKVIDINEFHKRVDDQYQELEKWYIKEREKFKNDPNTLENEGYKIAADYYNKRSAIAAEAYKDLISEGKYRTFIVEGILDEDPNYQGLWDSRYPIVLMNEETLLDFVGLDSSTPTGIRYHFKKPPRENHLENIFYTDGYIEEMLGGKVSSYYTVSDYFYSVQEYHSVLEFIYGAAVVVLFVLTMSLINSINATGSNLHLRRREFAQLRVIGVSKKHLTRMVLLEGILTAIVASEVGIVVGFVLSFAIYWSYGILYGVPYHFPVGIAIFAIIFSCVVLSVSIYFPLSRLDNNMADDLKTSGD